MKKTITFIIMLILLCGGVFAWSTSNYGNINVRGWLNVSNSSETSVIYGDLITGGGLKIDNNGGHGNFGGIGTSVEVSSSPSIWNEVFYDENYPNDYISTYVASAGRGAYYSVHSNIEFDALMILGSNTTGIRFKPNPGGITSIGTATPTHDISDYNDTMLSGNVEIDGTAYLDKGVNISGVGIGDFGGFPALEVNYNDPNVAWNKVWMDVNNPSKYFVDYVGSGLYQFYSYADLATPVWMVDGEGGMYFDPVGNFIELADDVNVTWNNGASISVNSTCIILTSPAGTGTHAVCD